MFALWRGRLVASKSKKTVDEVVAWNEPCQIERNASGGFSTDAALRVHISKLVIAKCARRACHLPPVILECYLRYFRSYKTGTYRPYPSAPMLHCHPKSGLWHVLFLCEYLTHNSCNTYVFRIHNAQYRDAVTPLQMFLSFFCKQRNYIILAPLNETILISDQ